MTKRHPRLALPLLRGSDKARKKLVLTKQLMPPGQHGANLSDIATRYKTMKTATFVNFTDKPFVGYWDGKPKTFKPGTATMMPENLARHYAKHLSNKVLLEKNKEKATSPKFPEQVPDFMEEFNKAFIMEEESEEKSEAEVEIEVANQKAPAAKAGAKKATSKANVKTVVDNKPPQMIGGEDENADFEEGLSDK